MQNKTWFTLVELIVVITILSVLATIWFISFTGYGASARDSVRLSDIHNIEKSLWIYKIKEWKYPEPDNKVDVKSSGATLTYQWYAGKKVLWLIWVHGWWVDPITEDYYTLVTNIVRTKYQLLSYFENEENITKQTSFINKTKASLIDRYPQLSGDKLWIIVNNTTKEPLQTTGMDLDISNSTSTYELHLSQDEIISWNNVSLWAMYSKSSCNRLKEFDNTLPDGKYMIDPLADWNEFEVLCDMTTDWWGWTLYTAKNKYNYPDIWYFNIDPLKQTIIFSKIRWNFISPQGRHLPLIYRIFNQKEWNLLLEHNEGIQNSIYIDEINHYKTPEQFAEAFSFGVNDTHCVNRGHLILCSMIKKSGK